MTDTVLYSTLLLTLLMIVGLVFFIRASTKDRIETLMLTRPADPLALLQDLTAYFEARAYAVIAAEAEPQRITLRGRVRPSLFLAGFLTLLAAVGALCFALVLANLWPAHSAIFLGLLALSPGAGWFYWHGADRDEEIRLEVRPDAAIDSPPDGVLAKVAITAHRDELIALNQGFDR
ncbi:cofactor assembly of complex C subunit B [Leptolyngbya sp. CCNP1308]|uniref:cofactor assembly of complex C subunit B n=1 Tax=Leptolyngbya sp. CCNP1308 TaxID=3110255 RepID=UPI002B21EEE3|nr:cofactor assembly of complex C subunit B [Leptolyngbya sp. CCNP1308]MEA5451575.1 cofactor assembly of complex C subunit B [Leptolyngbya sp. CCNP1308]